MATFEYPFVAEFVRDWTPLHGLRELGANAKDGDTAGHPMTITYDSQRKRLLFRNQGVKLDSRAMLLGGTTKADNAKMIGTYGEGMKLAFLVLSRAGFIVIVRNGMSEDWRPKMEYSEKWGSPILQIEVRKASRQVENLEIEVVGVEAELWEELQGLFLFLKTGVIRKTFRTGEILFDAEQCGRIYVRGVFVEHRADYTVGYNFYDVEMNRDRKALGDLDEHTARLWSDWIETGGEVATIFDMMSRTTKESESFRWFRSDAFRQALGAEWTRRHGAGVHLARTTQEVEEARHFGVKAVVAPNDLTYDAISDYVPTVYQYRRTHRFDVTKTYALDELAPDERAAFEYATALLERVGVGAARRVSVVDFADPKVRGLYRGGSGDVCVARSELPRRGRLVMTLVHEFAHDFGDDGSHAHTTKLQEYTELVVEALAARPA